MIYPMYILGRNNLSSVGVLVPGEPPYVLQHSWRTGVQFMHLFIHFKIAAWIDPSRGYGRENREKGADLEQGTDLQPL